MSNHDNVFTWTFTPGKSVVWLCFSKKYWYCAENVNVNVNFNVNICNALEFSKEQMCGYLLWSIEAKMIQVRFELRSEWTDAGSSDGGCWPYWIVLTKIYNLNCWQLHAELNKSNEAFNISSRSKVMAIIWIQNADWWSSWI